MSRVVELLCSRRTPQLAVLALMSVGFSGCSSDMQTRFSQNPFQDTTGSVAQQPPQQRELPQYARPQYQPQPQYQSQALPPPISAPQSYPSAPAGAGPMRPRRRQCRPIPPRRGDGVSGGGRGMASYAPPSSTPAELVTGSSAPRSAAAKGAGARHPHHRRHQRYAGDAGAALQRLHRRDPAGQRLQGPARAAARPAADHPQSRRRRGAAPPRPPARNPAGRRRQARMWSMPATA